MLLHRCKFVQVSRSYFGRLGAALLLGLVMLLAACGSGGSNGNQANTASCSAANSLNGGGSTFDNPLFSKMFIEYAKIGCHVHVNYQSIGSGAGINDLLQNVVDFGATDSPMKDADLAKSTNGPILHIPVTLGTEAIIYNLPGIPSQKLRLAGPILANIYLGSIHYWDDPAIKQINADLSLPHTPISVVHRSDGSGTTGIFTHYLSDVSPDWKSKIGSGTTVAWPTGVGGKGNEGVAAQVESTAGAIGYAELAYAVKNNINYALVENQAGKFLPPSLDGAQQAAASVTDIPDDLRFFITNASGDSSYPISGFSWAIVYQNQQNAQKGQALADLLWWMVHDGQQYAAPLTYAPLPDAIVKKDEAKIKSLECGSSPCYKGTRSA
jgi:phosphate transport system substrate-binding protein